MHPEFNHPTGTTARTSAPAPRSGRWRALVEAVRRRHRPLCLVWALVALLGGAYFALAPRWYRAQTTLLLFQGHEHDAADAATVSASLVGRMPTYEQLLGSDLVLEAAVARLPSVWRTRWEQLPNDQRAAVWARSLQCRARPGTSLLDLEYLATDPQSALIMLRSLIEAYAAFLAETQQSSSKQAVALLTRESDQLQRQLQAKEQELAALRKKCGSLGASGQEAAQHPLVRRAMQLNEALIEAQKKRLALQATLASVQAAVRGGHNLEQHVLAIDDARTRELLLENLGYSTREATARAALRQGLSEDQAQLKTMLETLGPAHPKVVAQLDKVRSAEQALEQQAADQESRDHQARRAQLGPLLIQTAEQKVAEAWRHEQSLRAGFEQARAEANTLHDELAQLALLERDTQWLRNLRETLLEQMAGVDLRREQATLQIRQVRPPAVQAAPVSPRLGLTVLVTLGLCGLCSVALVALLEWTEPRFHSADELHRRLGTAVWAAIGRLPLEGGLSPLVVQALPAHPAAEAFRGLRTLLTLSEAPPRVVAITSPRPGDGKTTIVANLAVACAQSGRKTLLIDADLRQPGLTRLFGLSHERGLANFLVDGQTAENLAASLVCPTGLPGLDLLCGGTATVQAIEQLSGQRWLELLAWSAEAYDQVLCDVPPVLSASETAVLAHTAAGVLLVVRPEVQPRQEVGQALEKLSAVGAQVLGLVANQLHELAPWQQSLPLASAGAALSKSPRTARQPASAQPTIVPVPAEATAAAAPATTPTTTPTTARATVQRIDEAQGPSPRLSPVAGSSAAQSQPVPEESPPAPAIRLRSVTADSSAPREASMRFPKRVT